MKTSDEIDEWNIALLGIGFLPGFLYSLDLSVESVILKPFFADFEYFEPIVTLTTIMGFAIGVFVLFKKSELKKFNLKLMCACLSVFFGFISGFFLGLSTFDKTNLFLIVSGILLLLVSFSFTIPSLENKYIK